MRVKRDRYRGWTQRVANFRTPGGAIGWLHRADEGGVWFGHVYFYCPWLFHHRRR